MHTRMEVAQWALRMLWCEGFWFLDSCDPLLRYDCCNAHYSCVLQVWAASSSALPIMRQYTLARLPCGRPLLLFLSLPCLVDLLSSSYAIFLPLHSRRAIIIHWRSHAISLFSTNHPFNSWNEERLKGNSLSDSNPEIRASDEIGENKVRYWLTWHLLTSCMVVWPTPWLGLRHPPHPPSTGQSAPSTHHPPTKFLSRENPRTALQILAVLPNPLPKASAPSHPPFSGLENLWIALQILVRLPKKLQKAKESWGTQ